MELPTYTNIWRIEKRLYKLYDFRLPMPLPIGQLVVFAAVAAPYILVLALLGVPLSHTLVWLYILPPGALTWLVTRPVLEGKRLPELISSQVRYLSEPRTWCRMAPLAEKDEIILAGRVWRQARPLQLATAGAEAPVAALAAPGVPAAESPVPGVSVPGVSVPGVSVPGVPVPDAPVADVPAAGRPAAGTAARAAGQARARWPQARGGMSAATIRLALASRLESGTGWPEAGAERSAPSAPLTGTGWPVTANGQAPADRTAAPPGRSATSGPAFSERPAAAESPVGGRPAANGRTAASGWPEAASARPAGPAPAQARRSAAMSGPGPSPGSSSRSAMPPVPARARVVARPVPRPAVTITGDAAAQRPMRVVERALGGPLAQRAGGWNEHVVVVPGGHRPGHPDQRERDRIRARMPLSGRRRVVLLGCTVGAGQTTTTLLTGRTLATARDEPVAVLDLNPAGRGSLTERARTVSGLLPAPAGPAGQDRDDADSGLQVITGSGPADGDDAGRIIEVVAARYPLTLTDPAAGAVPRALAVADQLVLIAPASADAANAIAMTHEWLEAHGYARLAAAAITVLNGVSQQTMLQVERAAAVARGRSRAIVRVPWDDRLRDLPARHRTAPGAPEDTHPGEPLGPAAAQAYEALAGLLVASLAGPADLRGARA